MYLNIQMYQKEINFAPNEPTEQQYSMYILYLNLSGEATVLYMGAPYPCHQGIKMCNKHNRKKQEKKNIHKLKCVLFLSFFLSLSLSHSLTHSLTHSDEFVCLLSDLPTVITYFPFRKLKLS